MEHASLDRFLRHGRAALATGPVALIFAEDDVELASTLEHHLSKGFRSVVLFARHDTPLPEGFGDRVHLVRDEPLADGAVPRAVNAVAAAAPRGNWIYYGYNAEYLFYPFAETRTVGEMLAFHTEERRNAMLCYVVDLYAADLGRTPGGVSRQDAHLDRAGYSSMPRLGPDGAEKDRQRDFFGGLRLRFEEHVAPTRRKIDRIALFRARPGITLRADHTFDDDEMNTYACPWHNNLTAAICSFKAAKALRANPDSRAAIGSFQWVNSVPFEWSSRQLLDLGLIEPGQWF